MPTTVIFCIPAEEFWTSDDSVNFTKQSGNPIMVGGQSVAATTVGAPSGQVIFTIDGGSAMLEPIVAQPVPCDPTAGTTLI